MIGWVSKKIINWLVKEPQGHTAPPLDFEKLSYEVRPCDVILIEAGGQLKEPVHINDIRRWAQGMQNPNPLYYDETYAAEGVHGELIAPQSFTVCTDVGMGATPAIQGHIEGQHMLFGGDEWWFFA